jgi:hypothetical protein
MPSRNLYPMEAGSQCRNYRNPQYCKKTILQEGFCRMISEPVGYCITYKAISPVFYQDQGIITILMFNFKYSWTDLLINLRDTFYFSIIIS